MLQNLSAKNRIIMIHFFKLVFLTQLFFVSKASFGNSSPSYTTLQNAAICDLVAATNIGVLYHSSNYTCTNGIPDSDVCTGVWAKNKKVTCLLSVVTSIGMSSWLIAGTIPSSLGLLSSISSLSLFSNSLYGTVPTSIGLLSQLITFDVSINKLTGAIPSSIGYLTALKNLRCFRNSFSNSLPSSLGNLVNVIDFRFYTNHLSGTIPSSLGGLVSVTYFSMYSNNFLGMLPNTLGKLTTVKTMWIYSNSLSGRIPSEFGLLSSLSSLYLFFNKLTGIIPSSFGQLSSLALLRAQGNSLTGTLPSSMYSLSNLIDLELNSNELIGTLSSSLGNLVKLRTLALSSNNLGGPIPTSVGFLTNLLSLGLNHNCLTGTIPSSICKLTNLLQLYLGNNKLTGTIPTEFTGGNMILLSIPYNSLEGSIPKTLQLLSSLESVILNNNMLSGSIEASFFSSWTALFSLHLQYNKLTGSIPFSLEYLAGINVINLNNNKLRGTLPAFLGSIASLALLQVQSNSITGSIPSTIAGDFVTYLDISNNQLEGTVPYTICNKSLSFFLFSGNTDIICYPSCLTSIYYLGYGTASKCDEGVVLCNIATTTNIAAIYPSWSCDGFIPETPICAGSWNGVTCSSTNNIIAVDLAALSLTGSLPTSLASLTSLADFNISRNSLTGTIPQHVGGMSSLVRFDVSYNHFHGSIPSSFGALSSLQAVFLNDNSLSSKIPPTIAGSSLTTLEMSRNVLTGSLPSELCSGYIRTLSATGMDTLSCYSSCLSTVTNKDYGTLTSCTEASCLCDLLAATNSSIALTAWKCEGSTPVSNVCNGVWSGVTCAVRSDLSTIVSLGLRSRSLLGTLPSSLGSLYWLTKLDIAANSLYGTVPSTFGRMSKMQDIDMSYNSLSGAIPTAMCTMIYLQSYYLAWNRFVSTIPYCIGAQGSSLLYVNFEHNKLFGTLPAALGDLHDMIALDLSDNAFSGSLTTAALGEVLLALDVSNNKLTGTISSDVCSYDDIRNISVVNNSGLTCYDSSCIDTLVSFQYGDLSVCATESSSSSSSSKDSFPVKYIIIICVLGGFCCCCAVFLAVWLWASRKTPKRSRIVFRDLDHVLLGECVLENVDGSKECMLYRGTLTLKSQEDPVEVDVVLSRNKTLLLNELDNLLNLYDVDPDHVVRPLGFIKHTHMRLVTGATQLRGWYGIVTEASSGSLSSYLVDLLLLPLEEQHSMQDVAVTCLVRAVSAAWSQSLVLHHLDLGQFRRYHSRLHPIKLAHTFSARKNGDELGSEELRPLPLHLLPPEVLSILVYKGPAAMVRLSPAESLWTIGLFALEIFTGIPWMSILLQVQVEPTAISATESSLKYEDPSRSGDNHKKTVERKSETNSVLEVFTKKTKGSFNESGAGPMPVTNVITSLTQKQIDDLIADNCPGPRNWLRRQLLHQLLRLDPHQRLSAALSVVDPCEYLQSVDDSAISLFITKGVSTDVILSLLNENPVYYSTTDKEGLLPVQLALKESAEPTLISTLLEHYPESTLCHYFPMNETLIQFAVEHEMSVEYVNVLLPYFMPIEKDGRDKDSDDHNYGWTSVLHKNEYATCVSDILKDYYLHIHKLAYSKDELGRSALNIAAPACKAEIEKVLYFLGMYDLSLGVAHQSFTCTVRLAVNTKDGSQIAIKFMKNKDQFLREVSVRTNNNLSEEFVMGFLVSLDADSNEEFREELGRKGFSEYRYAIVMPRALKTIQDVIQHEHVAGKDWSKIRQLSEYLLQAVRHLHSRGLVHSDIKPLNIMRYNERVVLIDLDATVSFKEGQYAGAKYSSGYMPPELVHLHPSNQREGKVVPMVKSYTTDEANRPIVGNAPYDLIPAQPSYDIWSLGVTLFYLCTGKNLFPDVDNEDNIDDEGLVILSQWSEAYKNSRLENVADPLARNLLSQLLSKQPNRRPSAERALAHPFLTGKRAARMLGEEPEFDVFISYRVASDAEMVKKLYDRLTANDVTVWWDKKCLEPGQPWEEGFGDGLAKSRAFLPVISREAINSSHNPTRQNFSTLTSDSYCDNVFLEYRLALEMRAMGLIESIYPILIGDMMSSEQYSNYFSSGCLPRTEAIVVKAVEEKVSEHLSRQGLGAPVVAHNTVSAVLTELLKNQGGFVEGDVNTALQSVVDSITNMVRRSKDKSRTNDNDSSSTTCTTSSTPSTASITSDAATSLIATSSVDVDQLIKINEKLKSEYHTCIFDDNYSKVKYAKLLESYEIILFEMIASRRVAINGDT